jgi:putative flavoprotein involved in K+ transport
MEQMSVEWSSTLEGTSSVDVVVVGAGQAGLVTGYCLRHTGFSFVLYEHHPRIGDAWRHRYDSLVLFSPRAYSALPGQPLPGDPEGYPTKDEIADYLEHYAQAFDLPVHTAEGIVCLARPAPHFLALSTTGQRLEARAVIVATGAFQQSVVPGFARTLTPHVVQLTAATYRRPAQLPPGRVLVVGDGATGRQIAAELVATHAVALSTGKPWQVVPQRLLGKDTLWWFDMLGAVRTDKDTRYGRWVRAHDAIPGWHLRRSTLRRLGVQLVPRTTGAVGRQCQFADGTTGEYDAVIWTLGYRDEVSWMQIPGAVDAQGHFLEDRGISPVPGLFYVGRSWQTTRASALLCGVGADAAAIVDQVRHYLGHSQPVCPSAAVSPVRMKAQTGSVTT